MRTLRHPRHTATDTFSRCISRVREHDLKARLQSVTNVITEASDEFHRAATRHRQHEIEQEPQVGGIVTTEEMSKVYSQRMAKLGSPGRSVYDAIMGSSPQGRCPLCDQRDVSTLDHHLPKSHYPALAVAPPNLIPSCTDCNKAKHANYPQTTDEVPLHPYYDNIEGDRWLNAQVIESAPAALKFQVTAPDTWEAVLTSRVRKHFDVLGLSKLYGSQAAGELVSIRTQLEKLLIAEGKDAIHCEMVSRAASCDAAHLNGWRAAAYHAWADSDWFCDGGFAGE